MTSNFPLDRIQRRERRKAFVIGALVGAILMFGALAVASLYGSVEAAQTIVRGQA